MKKISRTNSPTRLTRLNVKKRTNSEDLPLFERTSDFFDKIVSNLAKASTQYANNYTTDGTWEFPLRLYERNMYSALACAVGLATPLHMSELPFDRKARLTRSKSQAARADPLAGRIDLWCRYKGCDFAIELKRASMAIKGKNSQSTVKGHWTKLNNQLDNIREDLNYSVPKESPAVRLGIYILYVWCKYPNQLDWSDDLADGLCDRAREMLGNRLKFLSVVEVPGKWMVRDFKAYGDKTKEFNPIILIAGTYRYRSKLA
jgi:hypothetical protein